MRLFLINLLLSFAYVTRAQLSYPYKVFSENEEYFIKSVPFYDQAWTIEGKTFVCKKSDTTKIVSMINRYFTPDQIFLSNDGRNFCFIERGIANKLNEKSKVISFFQDGVLIKAYNPFGFIDTTQNVRIHSLFYHNEDIDSTMEVDGRIIDAGFKKGTDSLNAYFNQHHVFVKDDTLYLLSQNKFVNRFNMKNGSLIDKISFSQYKMIYPTKRIVHEYKIDIPTQFGLPSLLTGEDYCNVLAKNLGMVYCDGKNADNEHKYRHYYFEINCCIDSAGNCIGIELDSPDSALNQGTRRFLKQAKFNKSSIPVGIEQWWFHHIATFRNESKRIAKKQRKQEIIEEKYEYEKRIKSDSIDGKYIPKDIEDCIKQLNSMLNPIHRRELKNKDEKDLFGYHFGLGLWLRNDWNLWHGSRLSIYFNQLGVTHPDDMSGLIITSFHRAINGKKVDLEGQIANCKLTSRKR